MEFDLLHVALFDIGVDTGHFLILLRQKVADDVVTVNGLCALPACRFRLESGLFGLLPEMRLVIRLIFGDELVAASTLNRLDSFEAVLDKVMLVCRLAIFGHIHVYAGCSLSAS